MTIRVGEQLGLPWTVQNKQECDALPLKGETSIFNSELKEGNCILYEAIETGKDEAVKEEPKEKENKWSFQNLILGGKKNRDEQIEDLME